MIGEWFSEGDETSKMAWDESALSFYEYLGHFYCFDLCGATFKHKENVLDFPQASERV